MTVYLNQNFEGAGFDNSETWLAYEGDTGAADPDYTTGPLKGSQSLRMLDDDTEGTYVVTKWAADAGVNTVYGYCRIKILNLPNAGSGPRSSGECELIQHYDIQGALAAPDSVTAHEMIWIDSDGYLLAEIAWLNPGNPIATASTPLSINTLYHLWWYINRTTDSDGNGWIKVATTGVIPGTNLLEWSGAADGNDPAWPARYTLNGVGVTTYNDANYEFLVDDFRLESTAIGSTETAAVVPTLLQHNE